MGPPPAEDERDLDLMNAGKRYVTAVPGAAYFHHADSFSMIRGGHIDVCVLGTMQVAANGDHLLCANSDVSRIAVNRGDHSAIANDDIQPVFRCARTHDSSKTMIENQLRIVSGLEHVFFDGQFRKISNPREICEGKMAVRVHETGH